MNREILGQSRVIAQLEAARSADRLPSAYLFLGPKGLGKSSLARVFAQQINCDSQNSCGHCDNCRLFASGAHPDFLVLGPSGKQIKIAQIQDLTASLALKPSYAIKRVVLVKQAQLLGIEAANAFLKLLEEPPLDSLLILTAEDERGLLDTILSRCQRLPFERLGPEDLGKILSDRFSMDEEALALVLNYSEGRVRKELVEKAPQLLALQAQVAQFLYRRNPEALNDHFTWVETLVKQDLERFFLEFLARWFRDLSWGLSGQGERSGRPQLVEQLTQKGGRWSLQQASDAFDLVLETTKAVEAQAGRQLALEGLLLKLEHLQRGALVL
ncbi:MAG: DNA polymerase III subunit delta' [bacterium]|nr:DNA polymerase III subunit delta' [bacterium]